MSNYSSITTYTMAPKILVVLSSFAKIESINHETGWYLVSHPAIHPSKHHH